MTCALEVRELWKLSPPILSRCTVVTMRSDQSYRVMRNATLAGHIGLLAAPMTGDNLPAWQDIPRLRAEGRDPYQIIELLMERYGIQDIMLQDCIRAIGSGSSPWIQLSKFLLNSPPRSKSE